MEDNITVFQYGDKAITLIGTAHVSKESARLVKKTIDEVLPDSVCIELDEDRYKNIQNPKFWENTNVSQIIKEKKVGLMLANIALSSYQKRMAKEMHTTPGQEMLQGIQSAEEYHCNLVLADRNIQITFLRIWRKLSLWVKCKLFVTLLFRDGDTDDDVDLENLMNKDNLKIALSSIDQNFPQIAEILIHERDQYLANKIKTAAGNKIVAIVGAAHIQGIQKEIYKKQDMERLSSIPKPKKSSRVVAWIIPTIVFLLIAYGFATNMETGLQQMGAWVLWNSSMAAIFTAMALGHPLSILTSFVLAPITSLNPLLACGWFTGLVEANIRKPTVGDINNVPEDIFHIKRIYKNRFLRALAVVLLTNIGSVVGTFIAGSNIIGNLI